MRRLLALLGFMLVLALAAALLWRVYLHHRQARPYTEEPTVVRLDAEGRTSVKFAHTVR
jgi:hypothetical protein